MTIRQTVRVAVIGICCYLLLSFMLFSCSPKQVEPVEVHTEILEVKSQAPDTVIIILTDSVHAVLDSFIQVQPPQETQLLSSVEEFESTIEIITPPPIDSLIDAIYMSQVGVRELTGHNDGKDVEKYLKAVNLPKGNAWCAAFVKWCFDQVGVRTTITGWSPTANNTKNLVLSNGVYKKEVQRGDVFTIYFPSMKRIAHTGFVRRKFGLNSLETVEGNTDNSGGREGQGVYLKIRPKSSLYTISRWF